MPRGRALKALEVSQGAREEVDIDQLDYAGGEDRA